MNQRLLIVDDDPNFLELCQFLLNPPAFADTGTGAAAALRPAPFDVVTVANAEQAIAQVQTAVASHLPFAGIFLDIQLEGKMNGIETLRKLAECDPNVLFLVVTRSEEKDFSEVREFFGPEGAHRWDFLASPFGEEEFRQKADHLVSLWNRREKSPAKVPAAPPVPARPDGAPLVGQKLGDLLQAMIGEADGALKTTREAKTKAALKSILKYCAQAADFVRGLQSPGGGNTGPQWARVDVPLREALRLLEAELREKGVKVVEDIPAELPETRIRVLEMTEVILTLILNAIGAGPGPESAPVIRVVLRANVKSAVIKIIDAKGKSRSVILPYRRDE